MTSKPLHARLGLMVVAASLATTISSCSSSNAPAKDDPVFAGLDAAVVQETLDSPHAQQFVANDPPDRARNYYQGMVRSTINCRAYLEAYERWRTTGVEPTLPREAQPQNPIPSVDQDLKFDHDTFAKAFSSGDPTQVRAALSAGGSCGEWVPVKPRDYSGPTVSDAVGGPVDAPSS